MINWPGLRLQCGLFRNPGSFGIDKIVSAKSRSGGGLRIDQPPQDRIKPWEDEIILMEDVNPFSARAFDAAIPDSGQSKIARLAMNLDTLSGNFANELSRRAVRRCIVNHLDLHLVSAGILFQH